MEIEIAMGRKNLTKAIVNQMQLASHDAIKHGKVLGYLINIVKDSSKSALIEHCGEYFLISLLYTKGILLVSYKLGKWSYCRKFDSREECNEWWLAYMDVKKKATVQIYI